MSAGSLHPAEQEVYRRLTSLEEPARQRLIAGLHEACRKHRLYYKKDYQPLGLLPFVVPRRRQPVLRALTRSIFQLQLKAPALRRENACGFADLIRLERRTGEWFDRSSKRVPEPWELLIRPDFGLRPDAQGRLAPVLYESNSLMLGGLYNHTKTLEIVEHQALPFLGTSPRALRLEPSPHLLDYLRRWLHESRQQAGLGNDGGLAFLESLPPGGGFSELPLITDFFKRKGLRAEHGDPRDLELRGGRVWLRGMRVAFSYRDFSFEDVGGPENPRLKAFAKLWQEGRVSPAFPSDFDQKGLLECLSSGTFERLFTRREVRLFRDHVPWTRVLTQRRTDSIEGRQSDLADYARKNRESLILKPSWSSGGEGIIVGRRVSQSGWEKSLAKGLGSPGSFVVQEFLDVPRMPTAFLRDGTLHFKECRSTLGIFFEGNRFGFHARVSPKVIVNVARGGALSAVYLEP